jgi:hypothetical protein
MKKWQISDIRWATFDDLNLPFWQDWNKKNPLPSGFWQRIWEYPYVAINVPKKSKTIDVGGTYPFVLFKNWPDAVSVDNRDLNKVKHPLLKNQWPKDKLIIADATNIPVKTNVYDYSISISAIEEMPNTVKVLKEMIRIAKHRVVVTLDVSEKLGVNRNLLRELEKYLGITLPTIPHNVLNSNDQRITQYNQPILDEYKHIRVLGIVIDSIDPPKDVGILIPHWESYEFADACIKEIQEQKDKSIKEKIYILDDQSKDGSYKKLKNKFSKTKNIKFIQISRPDKKTNADVGYLLDQGLKHVNEQFVAMIDADTFPLSRDWLSFPIWLIEKYSLSSVGLDTGLSTSYSKEPSGQSSWWQPDQGYSIMGGLYDNNWFTITNNLYRVMRTATAKVVSENIGFTRANIIPTHKSIISRSINLINKYFVKNKEIDINDRTPYLPRGCDNGVAANHFIDINRMGPKFNLPLTSYIGLTEKDGAYGQNICGLLFHFALSTRALSSTRREVDNPGSTYSKWVKKIYNEGEISTKLKTQMIKKSQIFKPGGYDNSIPKDWYTTELKYIKSLIKQFKKSNKQQCK